MGLPNHPVYRGGSFHLRLCETSFEKLITQVRHQQGTLCISGLGGVPRAVSLLRKALKLVLFLVTYASDEERQIYEKSVGAFFCGVSAHGFFGRTFGSVVYHSPQVLHEATRGTDPGQIASRTPRCVYLEPNHLIDRLTGRLFRGKLSLLLPHSSANSFIEPHRLYQAADSHENDK
jgi:hypothetical protein